MAEEKKITVKPVAKGKVAEQPVGQIVIKSTEQVVPSTETTTEQHVANLFARRKEHYKKANS
jgi:hypothetical protein